MSKYYDYKIILTSFVQTAMRIRQGDLFGGGLERNSTVKEAIEMLDSGEWKIIKIDSTTGGYTTFEREMIEKPVKK